MFIYNSKPGKKLVFSDEYFQVDNSDLHNQAQTQHKDWLNFLAILPLHIVIYFLVLISQLNKDVTYMIIYSQHLFRYT